MANITLVPLAPDDRNQFILDNQEAFNYGALEEFGRRDDHFEEEGEIISRETIESPLMAARPIGSCGSGSLSAASLSEWTVGGSLPG